MKYIILFFALWLILSLLWNNIVKMGLTNDAQVSQKKVATASLFFPPPVLIGLCGGVAAIIEIAFS